MDKRFPSRLLPGIVVFSAWLYHGLFKLGPAAFRHEYATPALQDFRRCCLDAYQKRGTWGVLLLWPLLFGEGIIALLAEHFSELFGRRQQMLSTMRRSMVAAFWAFVLFCLACIALGRTSDPAAPFEAVGRAHPEIGFAYAVVVKCFDIALLAVVLGGLPFLFVALKRSSSAGLRGMLRLFAIRPRHLLVLFGVALLVTLCFLGYLLVTQFIFGSSPFTTTSGQPPLFLALLALFLGLALLVFLLMAVTALFSVAVLRTEFGTGLLRFAFLPLALLALVMAASTLAAAFWTLRLWTVAPQFAASSAGLGNGQTAWVIAIILAMALSTVVTTGALVRGAQASRTREEYI